MAGPRSLSRSTKVTAPGASRKHAKGKGKHNKKKPPLATWDHDNSSADESVDEESIPTSAASVAASAGKKRPRAGSLNEVEPEVGDRDAQEADTRKLSGGASKRQRAAEGGGIRASGSDDEDDTRGGEKGEGEEEDGGGAAAAPAGGMGDVMARILGQKLDSSVQAPVLAKRKTKAMKEMENASVKRAESRGKSAIRRANMTQQFVVPDHTTTDYERQLKKIATRGVVALFNAISKRQNQGDGSGGGGGSGTVTKTAKASAAKGASRHAFLDMLKTGVKPTGSAGTAAAAAAAAGGKRAGGTTQRGAGAGADGEAEDGGRSWSVLKEDYMMGASSMKNWDQESADSEEDALGGPNDMSEDDSD